MSEVCTEKCYILEFAQKIMGCRLYQNVLINADQLNYDIHTFANGRIFTSFSSCLGISSWRICMRERTRGRESRLKQYGMCVGNRIARYSLQHSMVMSSR